MLELPLRYHPVERNDDGVISGLHLLSARGKNGFYKFRFGTRSTYPDNRDDGRKVGIDRKDLVGCPTLPALDFWDLLRALSKAINDGTYRPGPDRTTRIAKSSRRGHRTLRLQNIEDRVVQRGIVQIIQPLLDPGFDVFSGIGSI